MNTLLTITNSDLTRIALILGIIVLIILIIYFLAGRWRP